MTNEAVITRRAMLRAIAAGSIAAALAACGVTTVSGPRSGTAGATPAPTPPGPSPAPTATSSPPPSTLSPSATPVPLRVRIARMLMVGFRGLEIGPGDPIAVALAGGLG
ncbi:MAG TPA: hypothetical protein VIM25_00590, partial [Candidatus Limnocylindrales bacterium]